MESMIKSGKVENQQITQGLASFFCFCFHQNVFFLSVFFFKSQIFMALLFVSHLFSPITGCYMHHW